MTQDKLVETVIRLEAVAASLERHEGTFRDHEGRLRVLEQFRWWILGAVAVVTGSVTIAVNVLH